MQAVNVQRGNGPIVLGMPHTGTYVPEPVFQRLTPLGQTLADTDWHIDKLYDQLLPSATTVRANFHRYVIDANRDPEGSSLYPGQNTTSLVPMTDFDGKPLWLEEPDADDIEVRLANYHSVYHAALREELERVRSLHGVALLFDCHSIRSVIPYLFEGVLPDFNIGTNDGTTCSSPLERIVVEHCTAACDYTTTVNGRFKGGWTTRHYAHPELGVHTIQLEIAQSSYLRTQTVPFDYATGKSDKLRKVLHQLLNTLSEQLVPSA